MRRLFILLIAFLFSVMGFSQRHEIGLMLGGANGITDVGRTDYINPLPKQYDNTSPTIPIMVGFIYRRNINPQQGIRFNLDYAHIIDNDRIAPEDYRFNRGAKYSQNIFETSLVFEYNFFPINSEQHRAHSPYIFAGIGAFGYNKPKYTVYHQFNQTDDGSPVAPTSSADFETLIEKSTEQIFSFTIPFGLGYKYKFSYQWVVGVEFGFRPTFVDDIDLAWSEPEDFKYEVESGLEGSLIGIPEEIQSRNDELILQRQLGDYSNKDWYVFTGLNLTYTFGRPPCFCD